MIFSLSKRKRKQVHFDFQYQYHPFKYLFIGIIEKYGYRRKSLNNKMHSFKYSLIHFIGKYLIFFQMIYVFLYKIYNNVSNRLTIQRKNK